MPKNKICENGNSEIFNIPPYLIKPNPSLSRTDFSDTALLCLADSIKRYGILQPIAVRISEKGRYELVAGERRLRAAILLEMPTVPCIITESTDLFEYLSVIENIQREKLTMFDEARAIKRLYEKNGKNLSSTAKLLSLTESELKCKLRLCTLSRAEMQAVTSLGISEKRAVCFADVPTHLRYYTIKHCAEENCTYHETASLCEAISKENRLFPDDIENFVKNHLKELRLCKNNQKHMSPAIPKTINSPTVILRDLRAFEASLHKICKILENAGCLTNIRTSKNGTKTTYTVTVDTK